MTREQLNDVIDIEVSNAVKKAKALAIKASVNPDVFAGLVSGVLIKTGLKLMKGYANKSEATFLMTDLISDVYSSQKLG